MLLQGSRGWLDLQTVRFRFVTTTAQAFSSLGFASAGSERSLWRGGGGASIINNNQKQTALFSSSKVNGEDNSETGGKDSSKNNNREGKTGWNHKKPSEKSSFWESQASKKRASDSSSSSTTSKLRTGWLHNQQSPSSAPATVKSSDSSRNTSASSAARRRLELAMKNQVRNHRIVQPPTFHATGNNNLMVVTEHIISVPLVYTTTTTTTNATRLDVFFTIVEQVTLDDDDDDDHRLVWQSLGALSPRSRAQAYVQRAALNDAAQAVLYLQGGPGFGAPTPVVSLSLLTDASWAAKALRNTHFTRVVLMDQRGTGRSTPITKQTLELKFPNLFRSDGMHESGGGAATDFSDDLASGEAALTRAAVLEATDYLSNFRADNIVRDAEEIRDALLLPCVESEEVDDEPPRPWGCVLGQSFGGFCLMTYLSQVKHPPKICLLTGGIAPMLTDLDDVYTSLWERVQQRSLRYYEMYPGDVPVVKTIVRKLIQSPAKLPSGGVLTARRFLQLGLGLGGAPSSFASLHTLLSSALVSTGDGDGCEFNRAFLKRIDMDQSFDDHPIYFWLHESIYANSEHNSPTNWSAHRMYERMIETCTEFDFKLTSSLDSDEHPTLFFGEMVFPWMVEDYAELSGFGLRQLANALASKTDWAPLYSADAMKRALNGSCRAAAAVYYDDMYVDFSASEKVFGKNGPLAKCKVWINNEYQHSGLRDNGAMIFEKLYGMATGSVRTPS
jgi:hypothetical protein